MDSMISAGRGDRDCSRRLDRPKAGRSDVPVNAIVAENIGHSLVWIIPQVKTAAGGVDQRDAAPFLRSISPGSEYGLQRQVLPSARIASVSLRSRAIAAFGDRRLRRSNFYYHDGHLRLIAAAPSGGVV